MSALVEHGLPALPSQELVAQTLDPAILRLVGGTVVDSPCVDVETGHEVDSPYRIDQKPEALIKELYQTVLARREQDGGTYSGLAAVIMDDSSPFADVYRYVEAREFKIWYPNQTPKEFADTMHEEYDPYEAASKFILVMDTENMDEDGLPILVGMARAVGGRDDLLKTVNDMPAVWDVSKEDILEDLTRCDNEDCEGKPVGDPAGTWDFSSLAVTEAYRQTGAYKILSHELYRLARENGIHTVTTILVENLFDIYVQHNVPFRTIANVEPKVHMEEVSVPAVMHIPETCHLEKSDDPIDKYVWEYFGNNNAFDHFRLAA